jgi:predicted membrane channel-forming protein YqfA (hemolysin III family)
VNSFTEKSIDDNRFIAKGASVLSELKQYIASIALLIAILLAFSVVVYLVGKLRGKK